MEEVANSVPTLVDEVPQIGDLRELTMYIPESGCPYVLNQMLNRCKPVKVTLYAKGKNLLTHIVNHVDALLTHNISDVVIGHASRERGSTYTLERTTCLQDEVFEFLERVRQSLEIREEIERN